MGGGGVLGLGFIYVWEHDGKGFMVGGGEACLKRKLFCHLGGHFGFSCGTTTSVIVFVMTESKFFHSLLTVDND